jgi:hypothetical protein
VRRISLLAPFVMLLATNSALAQVCDARTALRSIGDLDGDGVRDLLVSNRDVKQRECVWAVSCKTGQLLYRIDSGMVGDGFGRALAEIGDVDKDGVSDFVVGATGARAGTSAYVDEGYVVGTPAVRWEFVTRGYVSAFSGKTGKLLFQVSSKTNAGSFGYALAAAGDVNSDGVPDFLIGDPFACECTVHSGVDGALVLTLRSPNGPDAHDEFGDSIANVGDVDADGRIDWAVGAPEAEFAPEGARADASAVWGAVFIVSGKDQRVLRTLRGEPQDRWFGGTLACAPTRHPLAGGYLAVPALNHHLRAWSLADWSLRFESRAENGAATLDSFGTSIDFVRDATTQAVTGVIVGATEVPRETFLEGYAELQPFDGKPVRMLAPKVSGRGVDVCGLDDLDGDHVADFALLDVRAMRLTFSSGKDDSKLREITLVQRAPTHPSGPPEEPTPR